MEREATLSSRAKQLVVADRENKTPSGADRTEGREAKLLRSNFVEGFEMIRLPLAGAIGRETQEGSEGRGIPMLDASVDKVPRPTFMT